MTTDTAETPAVEPAEIVWKVDHRTLARAIDAGRAVHRDDDSTWVETPGLAGGTFTQPRRISRQVYDTLNNAGYLVVESTGQLGWTAAGLVAKTRELANYGGDISVRVDEGAVR